MRRETEARRRLINRERNPTMLISHTFRGQEIDIDVTSKLEPYEWHFFGMTTDEYNALAVTADEEVEIATLIGETLYDRAVNSCPED